MSRTVLVTGAGGPLGVNLTRCLREGTTPARIIGTDANRWHLPLSLCDQSYLIPLARERDAYQRALVEVAAREEVEVIIPTHPVEVRAVAELHAEGGLGDMKTALPTLDVLEICDDKAATQERLQEAGVAVPQTVLLGDEGDLQGAFRALRAGEGEPVWVRGSGAPGLGIGGAALPCRSLEVARAWIEHHQGWGRMAASEFLPGDNLTWMALFSRGTLVAAGARERLEYVLPHVAPSGITGAPAVSRTVENVELEDLGERAVRAVDPRPHGVYFVDLKGDRDGRPRVTEINAGRCGTTVHFYARAGCNFPELLLRLALGEELAAVPEPNRIIEAGQYWVRTLDCGPCLVRERDFDTYPTAGGGAS
jgi:carbamoyl-phosphate synthase large subunit